MMNLKTAALAVLALGVSGAATAGMYAPPPAMGCTAGNVTVPCEKKGWMVGAEVLYVQVGNVGTVAETSVANTTNGVDETEQSFASDWTWGFRVEAAYLFGTGNDVNVNWTHFDKNSDQTLSADGDDVLEGYYTEVTLDDDESADTIDTTVNNHFDAVNLEFGQTVNFGEKVTTRFHAGLQYAQIKQTVTQSAYDIDNSAEYNEDSEQNKFSGVGPRAGIDSAYSFGNGFSIFGNVAAGLLVGQETYNKTYTVTDEAGALDSEDTESSSQSTFIVPEAEIKLGVAYSKPMADGDLKVQAGYQVDQYWSALDSQNYESGSDGNFNFQGVFLGLNWTGNA